MAIIIQGNSGVANDVDGATFRAVRVTGRPLGYGLFGTYAYGGSSGTMAAALAANSEIFQFRWPDTTGLAVVHRVSVSGAAANVAAGAAASTRFVMTVARAWTTAGSGGTRITLSATTAKLRQTSAISLVNDIGIATTGALTAGTKTLDTTNIGAEASTIGTAAITNQVNFHFFHVTHLLDATGGMMDPLVLARNEGFVVRTGVIFPTLMTWAFSLNVLWSEVGAF